MALDNGNTLGSLKIQTWNLICMYYFKVNKANSTMAVIRRSFQKLDEDTFVPLYKALVPTHLDHACYI